MTMVPAAHHQNLSKQQQQHQYFYSTGYGGCGANYTAEDQSSFGHMSTSQVEEGYEYNYCNNNITESDHQQVVIDPMAEDESRTNSVNEAGSSSKDVPEDHRDNERWLQLSIGGSSIHDHHQPAVVAAEQTPRSLRATLSSPGLTELDLLPGDHHISSIRQARSMQHMPPMFHLPYDIRPPPPSSSFRPSPFNNPSFASHATNLYFHPPGSGSSSSSLFLPQHHHQQEVNWAFRPTTIPHNNIGIASTSSSSSSFIQLGASYFPRPFHHQYHHDINVAGPSLDFRVVDPPRRSHSGIWFMLQASQNQ